MQRGSAAACVAAGMLRPRSAILLRPAPCVLVRQQPCLQLLQQQHRLTSQSAFKRKKRPAQKSGRKGSSEGVVDNLITRWYDTEKLSQIKQDETSLAALRKETIAAFPKLPIKSLARVGQASLRAGFGRSSVQSHLDMRWLDFWSALDAAAQQQLALPEGSAKDNVEPQDLVSLACSFADARYAAPEVLNAIAPRITGVLDDMRPRDISYTTKAFATLGVQAPLLFEAAGATAEARLDSFRPSDCTALLWSFAAADHARSTLFVQPELQQKLEHAELQEAELGQLHQWALWAEHRDLEAARVLLSPSLRERCRAAFSQNEPAISLLQKQVSCLRLHACTPARLATLSPPAYRPALTRGCACPRRCLRLPPRCSQCSTP